MLRHSAVYPRDFGLAVSDMMLPRGPRSSANVDLHSYSGAGDDRGALSDILKGSNRTWWRQL